MIVMDGLKTEVKTDAETGDQEGFVGVHIGAGQHSEVSRDYKTVDDS